MSYDLDSLPQVFDRWATNVAQRINPHNTPYVANEIKVGVLNVCTVVLLNTALDCIRRGHIPLTAGMVLINGAALLGRVVAERSIQPNFLSQFLQKIEISSNPNTPFPDLQGRGLFYISPFMKHYLNLLGIKFR